MVMQTCIEDLPYDVIHQVGSLLDVRAYTNLSRTSRRFHQLLRDDATARQCYQGSISHSCGRRLLPSESLTPNDHFRKGIAYSYDYEEAMRLAKPYSASIIGFATSFCYQDAYLCYSDNSEIRILNLNASNAVEKVIGATLFSKATTKPEHMNLPSSSSVISSSPRPKSLSIQGFHDDIVLVLADFGHSRGQHLFAIDIADNCKRRSDASPAGHHRILLCARLRSTNKFFARHNAHYLYYGTHTAIGYHGHHEWLLYGFDLQTGKHLTKEPIQLYDFVGSEIGSTACFEIFNGKFYALTNQTSFETEEVDWTSYYHYINFPLGDAEPDVKVKTIWRRQHREGPINDAWTDLGFQVDENTGELLIVECRKEWLGGSSSSFRTYYLEPFHRAAHGEFGEVSTFPPNDPLSSTLDSCSQSRFQEDPKPRLDKYVHCEFSPNSLGDRQEYLRTKTKWNGYDFNKKCFIDLVSEDVQREGDWRPKERLKLRVVSRVESSPLVLDTDRPRIPGGLRIRQRRLDILDCEIEDSEDAYTPSDVYVWPREPTPILSELDDILCPGGRAGEVKAALGDYGLIYMAGQPKEGGNDGRPLVFISFDPTWGFEGMKRLDGCLALPKQGPSKQESTDTLSRSVSQPESALKRKADLGPSSSSINLPKRQKVESTTPALPPVPQQQQRPSSSSSISSISDKPSNIKANQNPYLFWRDKAAYLSIAKGIWLR